MSNFEEAVKVVLHNEGGAVTPEDNGRGASKWGITLETYKEQHPEATNATIANLGPEEAALYYRSAFWERFHIGLIEDQELATKVLDLSVNLWGPPVITMLQKSAGVVPADGILGPNTAAKVNSQPAQSVLYGLREEAKDHYEDLVQNKPHLAKFLPGWLTRLNT